MADGKKWSQFPLANSVTDADLMPILQGGVNKIASFQKIRQATVGNVTWDEIQDLPSDFPPSAHTHSSVDITDLDSAAVGLGNVDNTSDLDKPVSTATAIRLRIPAPNMMADSGRFSGYARSTKIVLADASDPYDTNELNRWFIPQNGGTWGAAAVGKFINNNTDNGGSAGAMTATTIALVAAMGRTGLNARYGSEWRIAEFTHGTGTSNPHPTVAANYLQHIRNSAFIGAGKKGTDVFWLRAIGSDLNIGFAAANAKLYIDGVEVPMPHAITVLEGWKHVRIVIDSPQGYETNAPLIYGANVATAKHQIAIPGVFTGEVDVGMHSSFLANPEQNLAASSIALINTVGANYFVAESNTADLPASPAEGSVYIVKASDPTNPNKIAVYINAAWQYFNPVNGWKAYVKDTKREIIFGTSSWNADEVLTAQKTFEIAPIINTLTPNNFLYAGGSKQIVDTADLTFDLPTRSIRTTAGANYRLYGTADQTTNTEYLQVDFVGNVFRFTANRTGTGQPRAININSLLNLTLATGPFATIGFGSTTAFAGVHVRSVALSTSSSSMVTGHEINFTSQQSGTAGYSAMDWNITETSTGSGARYAWRAITAGTMRAFLDSAGGAAFAGRVTVNTTVIGASAFNVQGSVGFVATGTSSDLTAGLNHYSILATAALGNVTINLPQASTCTNRIYSIKKTDNTGNRVTIDGFGAELIDGVATLVLTQPFQAVQIQSTGSTWYVLSNSGLPAPSNILGPFVNLMSDSGRGTVKANPLMLTLSSGTHPFNQDRFAAFFASYGGASAWTEVGKFIHDNTTNGGSAGALTATTQDLIAAMGRTGTTARYGTEFYIAQRTAGTATTAPNPSATTPQTYLAAQMSNPVQALYAMAGRATWSFWIRCIDGTNLAITGTGVGREVYRNNAVTAPAGNIIITPADGWVHIRCIESNPIGYISAGPRIYTEISQNWQLALPAVFCGAVDTGLHTAPIPNINELLP